MRRRRRKATVDARKLREKSKANEADALFRGAVLLFIRTYPEVVANPLVMAKAKRIIRQEIEAKVYGIIRSA